MLSAYICIVLFVLQMSQNEDDSDDLLQQKMEVDVGSVKRMPVDGEAVRHRNSDEKDGNEDDDCEQLLLDSCTKVEEISELPKEHERRRCMSV